MSRIGCSALAIGLALLPAFAETPSIAWDQQKAEILRHHRSLIQIDTSNPPGNETKVVEYIKTVFDAEASGKKATDITN